LGGGEPARDRVVGARAEQLGCRRDCKGGVLALVLAE
jgi:hypothetical protein